METMRFHKILRDKYNINICCIIYIQIQIYSVGFTHATRLTWDIHIYIFVLLVRLCSLCYSIYVIYRYYTGIFTSYAYKYIYIYEYLSVIIVIYAIFSFSYNKLIIYSVLFCAYTFYVVFRIVV